MVFGSFAYKLDECVAAGLSSTCGIRKRMAEREEDVLGMFKCVVWSGVYSDSFERRAFRRS